MKVGRAMNRLRARWRLHRMEWNAMHRPLEPPRGYEHFYTEGAVFPGLKRRWQRKESLEDFMEGLKKAWKIYRHDFVYDPEVAKMEQQFASSEDQKAKDSAAAVLKQAKRAVKGGLNAADEFLDDVHKKAPEAQKLASSRIGVLVEAMNEFSLGYREGASGTVTFWDKDSDMKEPPNPPNLSPPSQKQQAKPSSVATETTTKSDRDH